LCVLIYIAEKGWLLICAVLMSMLMLKAQLTSGRIKLHTGELPLRRINTLQYLDYRMVGRVLYRKAGILIICSTSNDGRISRWKLLNIGTTRQGPRKRSTPSTSISSSTRYRAVKSLVTISNSPQLYSLALISVLISVRWIRWFDF